MKKEVSRPALAAIVAIVLLIICLIGWKALTPQDSSGASGTSEQLKAAHARKNKRDGGD